MNGSGEDNRNSGDAGGGHNGEIKEPVARVAVGVCRLNLIHSGTMMTGSDDSRSGGDGDASEREGETMSAGERDGSATAARAAVAVGDRQRNDGTDDATNNEITSNRQMQENTDNDVGHDDHDMWSKYVSEIMNRTPKTKTESSASTSAMSVEKEKDQLELKKKKLRNGGGLRRATPSPPAKRRWRHEREEDELQDPLAAAKIRDGMDQAIGDCCCDDVDDTCNFDCAVEKPTDGGAMSVTVRRTSLRRLEPSGVDSNNDNGSSSRSLLVHQYRMKKQQRMERLRKLFLKNRIRDDLLDSLDDIIDSSAERSFNSNDICACNINQRSYDGLEDEEQSGIRTLSITITPTLSIEEEEKYAPELNDQKFMAKLRKEVEDELEMHPQVQMATISELNIIDDAIDTMPTPPSPSSKLREVRKILKRLDTTYKKDNGDHAHGISTSVGDKPQRTMPLEVRVRDYSYIVEVQQDAGKIRTVYNSSIVIYPVSKFFQRIMAFVMGFRSSHSPPGEKDASTTEVGYTARWKSRKKKKTILHNINLIFQPGRSYLILGAPGSGKTTLLKAISGLLPPSNNCGGNDDANESGPSRSRGCGSISYNGRTLDGKGEFHIDNAFAYVDQLDRHAARFTVGETFKFASDCKCGVKISPDGGSSSKSRANSEKRYQDAMMDILLTGLGLEEVKDTFVGDSTVRGVSGGQRRRVTVGEMLPGQAAVLCGDEISTGLDAASTFDVVQVLLWLARLTMRTRIFCLLQPSPETVSLFDEIILLTADGRIAYAGPVSEVEDYFAGIGFVCPHFMDTADFLQTLSSGDASSMYDPSRSPQKTKQQEVNGLAAPTSVELAEMFSESCLGKKLLDKLEAPHPFLWKLGDNVSQHEGSQVSGISFMKHMQQKYANNFFISTWLVLKRFLVLWLRDKRIIIAGVFKNVIMGLSVGGCYFSTKNVISIQGALFQAGLFIILGAMQSASALIADRTIFYKHADANFYSAWPFVFGRALSQLPQITAETITFATILYYMIGLADRDDAANFFVYLTLLLVFAILMVQQLAVFASFASAGMLNAYSACVVLILVLFCGFIITPSTIPRYYLWFYWPNPFSWVYRALIVNEFRSPRWKQPDEILTITGFFNRETGEPFGQEWVGYTYAFCIPYLLICTVFTALGLTYVRNEGGVSVGNPETFSTTDAASKKETAVEIPFKPVTLSFRDICYEVAASTSSEQLMLLKNVNGVLRAGRLCALMGTSGAGKTTLMDVIALRKRSGTITGKVLLNGWPQEPVAFRRSSGYVEQFDVQTPELTVRETVMFSAKLRLEPYLLPSGGDVQPFVEQILDHVELSSLRDVLVGSDDGICLSFEQKKRLSIAVELAASPSILFLDEPTSGLDARSAMLVVKALRKIADGGRTVCATIHQPSSAVFGMFDDLLLMKKGGQVVYHGELGRNNCSSLVEYFESRGAEPIELGDNPANWMLRVMDSGSMDDIEEVYLQSEEYASTLKELDGIESNKDEESRILYEKEFAATRWERQIMTNKRLRTIYWRSPSYNYSRLLVSLVIAFVLGSSFITNRNPKFFTENDMRSRVSVIFLSFIITGVMAILSVLPVMTLIRDMYYRHRDAGMYDSVSMGVALGVAEKPFIIISTFLFTVVFLATGGFLDIEEPRYRKFTRSCAFFGFFTFNFAMYSYFGQLFVCLVKPMATAIILSSVFIGLNNFFSGLVVRPQFLVGTFYAFPFYITPGQYVYNGLLGALFHNNSNPVIANPGSEFFLYLNSTAGVGWCNESLCIGTAQDYVSSYFGGYYADDGRLHLKNALVLGLFLTASRLFTWIALKYIRFS